MSGNRGSLLFAWGSVAAATALAAGATAILFDASAPDLLLMTSALAFTGGAGASFATLAPRFTSGLPLRWQLTSFAAVALAGLVLNIGVAAGLMFLNPHDLRLLGILSAFAFVATVGPAQVMSRSVSRRFESLQSATAQVASGDLSARAAVNGHDELAKLAAAFNVMAARLEQARSDRDHVEAARRELFAAISHDLRTPLASMRAMVEAISDGVVTDTETHDRYLAAVSGEIERLSTLIDDLFELTTISSGEVRLRIETLRLEDVVAEIVDAFRPHVERSGIQLTYTPAIVPSTVAVDAGRLARVLYNVLQNAARHTPRDGTIVLRTTPAAGTVVVAVSDSGDGIPPEDLPFVFDRFYRGDKARARDGSGGGLGLAIARALIEAHGGRIWAESDSRGATVSFALPATEPAR